MGLLELLIIAVGLSMDALAVAVCKGLSMRERSIKKAVIVALYFGVFQGGMPLIGYILGVQFNDRISRIDHWIVFVLLSIIGINMLRESQSEEKVDDSVSFKNMVVLAIATSIDALAIGITFACLEVQIIPAVSFIGIITFVLSYIGVIIGNAFGTKFKSKAEIFGGIILIGMGFKILVEHLGLINFNCLL